MPTSEIVIHPLESKFQNAFLAFLDRDAFVDNPNWSSCYCQCYLFDHKSGKWGEQTAEANRARACQRLENNQMQGFLALEGEKVVGWCHAGPSTYFSFESMELPVRPSSGVIVCYIIAPTHRRQGIARKLLQEACKGLRKQGLNMVEAWPREGTEDPAANYHGPLGLYLSEGFEVVGREDNGLVHVRKELA